MQSFDRAPIGGKQSLTTNGFLLCRDVPIGRVGSMDYLTTEIGPGIPPRADGIVVMERTPEDLFSPETISSFEHAVVTIDHLDMVDPDNWKSVAAGYVQNVRQGAGDQANLLLADMVITDQAAIKLVRSGQREVSCGYNYDAVPLEPGKGRQINIRGNHVALVDKGRCGPVCAIGDRKPEMSKTKRTVWDRITTAFKAQDEAALTEAIAEAKEEASESDTTQKVEITVTPGGAVSASAPSDAGEDRAARDKALDERLGKLEDFVSKLATSFDAMAKAKDAEGEKKAEEKEGDEPDDKGDDPKKKAGDAAPDGSWAADWQDTVARAEILSPGIRLPARDSAMTKKAADDALCSLRRASLDAAFKTDRGSAVIKPLLGTMSADFKAMSCDTARAVFAGASSMLKEDNNRAHVGVIDASHATDGGITFAATGAERNKRNRDFWAKH